MTHTPDETTPCLTCALREHLHAFGEANPGTSATAVVTALGHLLGEVVFSGILFGKDTAYCNRLMTVGVDAALATFNAALSHHNAASGAAKVH